MDIRTQTFLVLGVSKSGYAAAEYILKRGGRCYFYEQLRSPKIDVASQKIIELGGLRVGDENVNEILSIIDVLLLSPGVPINHQVAVTAKQLGKRIIGELEFGWLQFLPTTVAITGTNGKTTTATLIDAILNETERKSCLTGNVGTPLTLKVNEKSNDKVFVVEVSSFQLESVNAFCPHVSCVLNISPDHLERHYTMDNYVYLKKRIYKNQRESEYTVLNYDDEVVRGVYPEVKAKVVWVSLSQRVDGAYRENGKLYCFGEYIIDEDKLKLKGDHNVYDTLFAIVVARLLGVSVEIIQKSLAEFKGVKHRMETVCVKNGVTYYNDSKATNTASTISALEVVGGNTVLILGGSEKGEDYVVLFEKIKQLQLKQVVITGASRFNMLEAAGKVGFFETTVTAQFDNAVKIASFMACDGESVLLSPACASFDSFSGYEERGERFIKLVEEL